jgi:outer membrane protein OmpA-like peptidoglycan-associated protein
MQKGKPGWAARLETAALAFALAGAMTACTAIDSGPEGIPGAERPFPNLASVPERPTGYPAAPERQAELDKLALDRAAAAPIGVASAETGTAPQPAPALPPGIDASKIGERDILGGGWLNADLPDRPSRALAGLIFFDNGSSRLKPKGKDVLRAVAALQRERGGVLRLIGHASGALSGAVDPAEGAAINRRVAQRRAESTAAELRRLGLASDQIEIGSEGSQAPAYDEATSLGEAGNRRVEIYLEL